MIKYHGTPVGGTKMDAIKFLNGRHALICIENKGQTAEVLECCESFCIDNGAFPRWKRLGGRVDVPVYKKFVEDIGRHPSFDFCIIPDVIMGSEKENDELINQWECSLPSIPVYHLGESIDRFYRLAENHHKICLGSTDLWGQNGSAVWWEKMADFMDEVTNDEGILPCKVHGLRMLDINIFQHLPLHSGDSTNAGVNGHVAMKKGILPAVHRWQGNERIAQRIEAFQSAPYWDREKLVEIGKLTK